MSRRLGLIIGANNFQDPAFRPLRYAENDARALAQWLVNTKGGKWAPGNVQHVQGTHATKELIESLITRMCLHIAEPGDLALIYFAGHAFVDERTGDGYLALTNTRYQDFSTALHLPSLAQNIFAKSRATHVLFVLDCFQNGQTWNMRRTSPYDSKPLLGPQLLNALQQHANRLFLCSCRGNELAPEAGERQLGLLIHQTILGLCGPAGDQTSDAISLRQLHNYLFGVLGEQQRPQLFGQDQPPLLLVGTPPANDTPMMQQAARSNTSSLFKSAVRPATGAFAMADEAAYATLTAQRETTGQLQHEAVDQHRQQRYQMMVQQAQQLLQAQKYPEAFTAIEQALQVIPDDVAALVLKAQILGNGGRTQDAFATVDHVLQLDENNALAWSIKAVLLSNTNQYQYALEAIEHALTIDPKNLEAYNIKSTITTQLAMIKSQAGDQQTRLEEPSEQTRPRGSIILAFLLRIVYIAIGSAGVGLLFLQTKITPFPGLILLSIGLLLLCTSAARGTHRYGFKFIVPTLITSLLLAGILGGLYKVGYSRLIALLVAHPTFMVPLIFMLGWLVIGAILPFICALGGLISGAATRKA